MDSFRVPRHPTKQSDWEAVRPIIKDLYLLKNVRLKDVIEIMQTLHHFRATARMYKAQFTKWSWHKYSTTSSARHPRKGKRLLHPPATQLPPQSTKFDTHVIEPPASRALSSALTEIRTLILTWASTSRATPFTRLSDYNPTMISHFVSSLLQLQRGDIIHGGRLLRAAFLELEDLVEHGHIAGVWDCIVAIPTLANNYQRGDILDMFLCYLARLCAMKRPGHPMEAIIAAVRNLGGDVGEYTERVWRVWVGVVGGLVGETSVGVLQTHRAWLMVQKRPDQGLVGAVGRGYQRLVSAAEERFGGGIEVAGIEFDMCLTGVRFGADAGVERRLEGVVRRLIENEGNPDSWGAEEKKVWRGCWFLGQLCAMRRGDAEREAECRDMFLEAPCDGDWVQYAMRMEEGLAAVGKTAEAEQVRTQRLQLQLPRDIVEILDEEEKLLC
ncbi:hypothetical protein OQA88_7755 [Cercophora sp. LCS_1]